MLVVVTRVHSLVAFLQALVMNIGNLAQAALSPWMDRENFDFLKELTKEQRSDFSKAVRDMVSRVESYSRWNVTSRRSSGNSLGSAECRIRGELISLI